MATPKVQTDSCYGRERHKASISGSVLLTGGSNVTDMKLRTYITPINSYTNDSMNSVHGLAANDRYIFHSDYTGYIKKLDMDSYNEIQSKQYTSAGFRDLRYSEYDGYLYGTCAQGCIYKINPDDINDCISSQINLGTSLNKWLESVTIDDDILYACSYSGQIYKVDTRDLSVIDSNTIDGKKQLHAIHHYGDYLYVVDNTATEYRIRKINKSDLSQDSESATIQNMHDDIYIDGTYLYVPLETKGIAKVTLSDLSVTTIDYGSKSYGMNYHNGYLFVMLNNGNQILRVDTSDMSVKTRIYINNLYGIGDNSNAINEIVFDSNGNAHVSFYTGSNAPLYRIWKNDLYLTGSVVSSQNLGGFSVPTSYNTTVSGLRSGGKYYFDFGAKNSDGWAYGDKVEFETTCKLEVMNPTERNMQTVGTGRISITNV